MNKTFWIVVAVVGIAVAGYFAYQQGMFGGVESAAVANSQNINLSANPAVVVRGGKAELVWSTIGFESCAMKGPTLDVTKVSVLPTKGTLSTEALSGKSVYTLTCKHRDGTVESKSLAVTVR